MCQPSSPGLTPGMSCSESDITNYKGEPDYAAAIYHNFMYYIPLYTTDHFSEGIFSLRMFPLNTRRLLPLLPLGGCWSSRRWSKVRLCLAVTTQHLYLAGSAKVKYYQEINNPGLSAFQPFDLDAWWGKKLYLSLTKDV